MLCIGGCNTASTATVVTPIATPATADIITGTSTTYSLDAQGNWVQGQAPAEGSDEAVMASAKRLIAEERASAARKLVDAWLKSHERTTHPMLPTALLLRGDATAASGDEYEALYDYERVIKTYPGSPEFVTAIEREMEIATRYLNGLKRKSFGIRMTDGDSVGEELLLRVHERLPGSRLAERAGIELADYYYRTRDLESAEIAYQLFSKNHPRSPYAMRAKQREIFSNLGRFKGPQYDTTVLLDASAKINRFMNQYPSQAHQTGLDEALISRIDDSRGEQLLETAEWYLRRDDPVSARLMLQRLVKRHPESAAAGKAMDILTQRGWLPSKATDETIKSSTEPAANEEAK